MDAYPKTESEPMPEGAETEAEAVTATLPKSLFTSVEKGQTVTLKVQNVYDDEVEVSLVESEGGGEPSGMTADQELDSMATE